MAKKKDKKLSVTLLRSPFGELPNHRECVRGLGLKKVHQTVIVEDTPSIRGLVRKIDYMLRVEDV